MRKIEQMLTENAVVNLWPEAGKLLGLGRSSTYKGADDGTIRTVQIGRLRKVPTAWLRRVLQIDGPAE